MSFIVHDTNDECTTQEARRLQLNASWCFLILLLWAATFSVCVVHSSFVLCAFIVCVMCALIACVICACIVCVMCAFIVSVVHSLFVLYVHLLLVSSTMVDTGTALMGCTMHNLLKNQHHIFSSQFLCSCVSYKCMGCTVHNSFSAVVFLTIASAHTVVLSPLPPPFVNLPPPSDVHTSPPPFVNLTPSSHVHTCCKSVECSRTDVFAGKWPHIGHIRHVYSYYWPEPHIYGVHRYFWQENHQIYGHTVYIYTKYTVIQCIYTVLADPARSSCVSRETSDPSRFSSNLWQAYFMSCACGLLLAALKHGASVGLARTIIMCFLGCSMDIQSP